PLPKGCRNGKGIDPLLLPPGAFVAAPMELAMVQPADRNGEAVGDLASHRPLLRKFDVVGIRGSSAADETRLRGDKPQMIAIALAHWLADSEYPRGTRLGSWELALIVIRPAAQGPLYR